MHMHVCGAYDVSNPAGDESLRCCEQTGDRDGTAAARPALVLVLDDTGVNACYSAQVGVYVVIFHCCALPGSSVCGI
jgi:hypothetical protein